MNDYSKWDKLKDSDDEEEEEPTSASLMEEEQEALLREQDRIDMWLRRQIALIDREPNKKKRIPGNPPELEELRSQALHYRKVTKEERKVLSMLIVMSHFEEGTTNLDRHPQMLELVRHHRWLEEDEGTLELLCRVHNNAMKALTSGEEPDEDTIRKMENPEDKHMRNMCMSGINTLAAPKKCKCAGLLELVTEICTPTTQQARERRKKWQKKEYAKDALFDSLFPDLRQFNDEDQDSGWADVWLMIAAIVLLLCVAGFLIYGPIMSSPKATKTMTTTVAAVAEAVASAAGLSGEPSIEGRESEL